MDTQLFAERKIVIYSPSNYEPVQHLTALLEAAGIFKVIAIDRLDEDENCLQDSYAVVVFITPTDFPRAMFLTNTVVKIVRESNVEKLAWVAPSAEENSGLERGLSKAAEIANNSGLYNLILRHAPVFSDLLFFNKEIKYRRTLSLPLGNNALPWVAPQDIAEGVYKWIYGTSNATSPIVLTGKSQLTGMDIAQEISVVLKRNLDGIRFARRCFQAIDTDHSGDLDRQEMFAYLSELAYTPEEAENLVDRADLNQDGSIDFEEFIAGLGQYIDRILADLPREVQYVNVPCSTVLYDLSIRGINEKTVQAWLALINSYDGVELPIYKSSAEWLGRGSTSFSTWLEDRVLDFINVYILPGKGILTISEGTLNGQPALTTKILQSEDRILTGVRTLDNRLMEWQWNNADIYNLESVEYKTDRGDRRILKFQNNRLVGMSVQGTWLGRGLANNLMFGQETLSRWQINLFQKLGELQIEAAASPIDPQKIVCNCTQTTCGQIQSKIVEGLDTLEKLAEKTQVTLICGGCQPLVEEMLGSANLDVAQILLKQDLGQNIFRFQFRPVNQPVVPYQPGQHILIQGRIDGVWVTRAYTLSSNADQNKRYEITVKRQEMGLFSRWLCNRADTNDLFRISKPRGQYILEDQPRIYFFAGGIGITPAISMMRTLASRRDTRPFYLDWSVSQPEDFFCQTELNFLQKKFPNFKVKLHPTRSQGKLTLQEVQTNYRYQEGAIAFLCGPQGYRSTVRSYLINVGWSEDAIRQELFDSHLNEDGNVELVERPPVTVAKGVKSIESDSFALEPIVEVAQEAEAYLQQCYVERGLPEVFLPRWQEVEAEIVKTGIYEHTLDELIYGARLAWRNSNRCVGRYFWQSLQIRDLRHLKTEEEMYSALVDHLKIATNNGDIRVFLTVFKPDGRRLWNAQLLSYAGYKQANGTMLGDPANAEFTEQVIQLGWQPPANPTAFDYLPLVIQLPGKEPKCFDIPLDVILDVDLVHPNYEWFKELGLKWYALPTICNMSLDLGGVQYTCTPFNGFYLDTEIGGRNLSDRDRYNVLPAIAQKMKLDCSSNDTLWRDRASLELNIAVLHSFKSQGVRIIDRYTMTDYFREFMIEEQKCQRPVYADWGWIVPPISGLLTQVYSLELENRILKPNYFYMSNPEKSK